MKGISTEAKVGLLVIFAIFILAYLTFRAGNYGFEQKKGYRLMVTFYSVAGLEEKAVVKVSGVDSGIVENISIVNDGAQLILRIKDGVTIRKNAIAKIQSLGLMGEKYIEIEPGTEGLPLLKDGDTIQTGLETKDINYITEQIGTLADELLTITQSIKTIVASQEGHARLVNITENIEALTKALNQVVVNNQREVNKLVKNLGEFSDQLNRLMHENSAHVSAIVTNLDSFSSTLSQQGNKTMDDINTLMENMLNFVEKNRDNITPAIESLPEIAGKLNSTLNELHGITERVNKGEGTIGRLFTDDKVYEEITGTLSDLHNTLRKADAFSLNLGFRAEYFKEYEKSKSFFSLKFQPKKEKYYLLEFVNDFKEYVNIKRTTTDPSGNILYTEEEKEEDKMMISLLLAQRFGPLSLKGGLIESKGGMGLDFFPYGDNFSLGIEAWDFDEHDPHLKLSSRFLINKYLFLNAGWDDFANSEKESFFAGAGFTFEDEDLKYILTKIPLPGL